MSSTSSHKRKRSIHDTPVDLTKMQLARERLVALQEELSGIEETAEEMEQIMSHVEALQDILGSTKKLKLGFSAVTKKDIQNMGIDRKVLVIKHDILGQCSQRQDLLSHGRLLCDQISRIYRFVSMRPGARMVLDAILLTVAEIAADGEAKAPVAIFPEMRVATGDGVCITNPSTRFQIWLTGNADYGLCTYSNESQRTRVLKAALDDAMRFARSRIMLIEGKREDYQLYDSMPEAISQAAALCDVIGTPSIRFCLSDGRNWIFSIFSKDENGARVCYEGEIFSIIEPRKGLEATFLHDVQQVIFLVSHWLLAPEDPLVDSLYDLKDM